MLTNTRSSWEELKDALGACSFEEEEEVGEKVKAQLAENVSMLCGRQEVQVCDQLKTNRQRRVCDN